jgi:electron transport complex protein RnfD
MNITVSHAPHIRAKEDCSSIMLFTILALLPAACAGVFFFGMNALVLILSSITFAVAAECLMLYLRKKRPLPADIYSSVITGLLLAMCVSSATSWWMCAIGSVFAVIIVKHAFGGLGFNIFNPALAARAFMLSSWPVAMTTWPRAFDAITGASHLAQVKAGILNVPLSSMGTNLPLYWQLFIGSRPGSLGETCIIALLAGALFLLIKGIIDWRIPTGFIGTVAVMSALFRSDPIFNILAGGLVLGAFFMATDPVTKPISRKGRWLFAIGCGIITVFIRQLGGYPEGVCYAILIMNGLTPLIDRYVIDRRYGH